MVAAIAASNCTQQTNPWRKKQTQSDAPPVAMQPVTIEGTTAPAAEATGDPAPETKRDTDHVLAYIERLPGESAGAVVPSSPPRTPAAGAAAVESAPAAQASANAPMSLAPMTVPPSPAEIKAERQASAAPTVTGVRVKSASPKGPLEPAARSLSTNEPLDSTASVREMTVSGYVAKLEAQLKKSPADVEAQWRLSALRLAIEEEDKALEISRDIAHETAGTLKSGFELLIGIRRMLVDPAQPADPLLARIDALRERLIGQADLEIPVVALCSRVMTFGVYDEMPADQLVPYQSNRTIVYSEIKNFASRPAEQGQFETLLSGKLELLTRDGRTVWQHEEPQIRDVSKQRRGDFFLAQLVSLPPNLTPGDYVLKVMIQDQLAGKANEGRLELSIKGTELTRK